MKVEHNVLLFLIIIASANAAIPKLTRMVVFGDSLSDNGNYYQRTKKPPSPPYFEGRNSNGPVWNEHIASSLNITLDNRAYSGAKISTDRDNATYQISSWIEQSATVDFQTTLFTLWIGGNDLLQSFFTPSNGTVSITAQSAESIRGLINTLIVAGAKYIGIFNLPDVTFLGTRDVEFNDELSKQLDKLSDANPNITIYKLNFPSITDKLKTAPIKEITKFESTEPCLNYTSLLAWALKVGTYTVCSDPETYLFWDPIHPTAAAHCQIAKAFGSVLEIPEGGIACDGKPTFAANLTLPETTKKSSTSNPKEISVIYLFALLCTLFFYII